MSSWSRFDEPELPPKAEFNSKLAESHITEEEYQHGQEVWKAFDYHNLGEHLDFYKQMDVLLVADVFEEFRSICLDYYGLDPAHYFTTPNLAWDALLKKTGVKLQLEFRMWGSGGTTQPLLSQHTLATYRTLC